MKGAAGMRTGSRSSVPVRSSLAALRDVLGGDVSVGFAAEAIPLMSEKFARAPSSPLERA